METDDRITAKYKLETFSYSTAKFELNPLRRIPTLKEVACALDDFIQKKFSSAYPEHFTDLPLVGQPKALAMAVKNRKSNKRLTKLSNRISESG